MTAFFPSLPPFNDFLIIQQKFKPFDLFREKGCLFFSGIAFIDGRCIVNKEQMHDAVCRDLVAVNDVRGATGEFTTIFVEKDTLYIQSDLLGMEAVCYFENSEFFLASNRLHALCRAMNCMNIQRTPNYGAIFAMLSSNYPLFSATFFVLISRRGSILAASG